MAQSVIAQHKEKPILEKLLAAKSKFFNPKENKKGGEFKNSELLSKPIAKMGNYHSYASKVAPMKDPYLHDHETRN